MNSRKDLLTKLVTVLSKLNFDVTHAKESLDICLPLTREFNGILPDFALVSPSGERAYASLLMDLDMDSTSLEEYVKTTSSVYDSKNMKPVKFFACVVEASETDTRLSIILKKNRSILPSNHVIILRLA